MTRGNSGPECARRHAVTLSRVALTIPVMAGICAWSACHPASHLFGRTRRRTDRDRTIALTFDDGPNPAVTPRLLDLLARYGARATFFVIGRYVRACPELVAEIVARGHAIGNHTDTHPNLVWRTRAQVRDELARCTASIVQVTGQAPRFMRPPYGYRTPLVHAAARQAGLGRPILWSKSTYDWRPQPIGVLRRRLEEVTSGDIVLMHDGSHETLGGDRRLTIEALEYWLPRWRDRGFDFVALDA